ncbi:hypothetical protein BD414DRAFT_490518 [Trametes punicea]|nr:hypothetical protein BD414DRAFT_490518 [Trametes punicea]
MPTCHTHRLRSELAIVGLLLSYRATPQEPPCPWFCYMHNPWKCHFPASHRLCSTSCCPRPGIDCATDVRALRLLRRQFKAWY